MSLYRTPVSHRWPASGIGAGASAPAKWISSAASSISASWERHRIDKAVHDRRALQQQAILIHDAPHLGFVIGCIGPRPWNDRRAYTDVANNPLDTAVQEIMSQLAKAHGKGALYVLRS